ncbi:DsrF protein [marine gamma proteobacterium HTCC2143]|uniref:DsrF protein n=1 Tax=marine gamma proteobacterium HTCC2143 TaxID=247633 RepID=A0YGR5_9GAMM|nr:DsrF protein [marine gamma proteobacterium HTCC2143]
MSDNKAKRILWVFRQAPYGNSLSREALDFALAAGVFDQDVGMVFIGDGVWQLLDRQDSRAIAFKNHQKLLSALSLYDITDIYVDQVAITDRQIVPHQLSLKAHIVSDTEITQLFESADVLLNF